MILCPAIDIKNGDCVRRAQGKAEKETIFSADPVAVAKRWMSEGASWLHIVDLDGAFQGLPVNREVVAAIRRMEAAGDLFLIAKDEDGDDDDDAETAPTPQG